MYLYEQGLATGKHAIEHIRDYPRCFMLSRCGELKDVRRHWREPRKVTRLRFIISEKKAIAHSDKYFINNTRRGRR